MQNEKFADAVNALRKDAAAIKRELIAKTPEFDGLLRAWKKVEQGDYSSPEFLAFSELDEKLDREAWSLQDAAMERLAKAI
jgi:hypothetical protein